MTINAAIYTSHGLDPLSPYYNKCCGFDKWLMDQARKEEVLSSAANEDNVEINEPNPNNLTIMERALNLIFRDGQINKGVNLLKDELDLQDENTIEDLKSLYSYVSVYDKEAARCLAELIQDAGAQIDTPKFDINQPTGLKFL